MKANEAEDTLRDASHCAKGCSTMLRCGVNLGLSDCSNLSKMQMLQPRHSRTLLILRSKSEAAVLPQWSCCGGGRRDSVLDALGKFTSGGILQLRHLLNANRACGLLTDPRGRGIVMK